MSRKLTLAVLFGTGIILLSLALLAATTKLREIGDSVSDAYAAEQVSLMIVEHIDRNGGRYPSNWDDLRPLLDTVQGRTGASFTFDEIRERVKIDFEAILCDSQDRAFRYLQNKSGAYVNAPNPNERIRARIAAGESGQASKVTCE